MVKTDDEIILVDVIDKVINIKIEMDEVSSEFFIFIKNKRYGLYERWECFSEVSNIGIIISVGSFVPNFNFVGYVFSDIVRELNYSSKKSIGFVSVIDRLVNTIGLENGVFHYTINDINDLKEQMLASGYIKFIYE